MTSDFNIAPEHQEDSASEEARADICGESARPESEKGSRVSLLPIFGTENLRVANPKGRNETEVDADVGQIRLQVLMPFAKARLGRPYEVLDQATGRNLMRDEALPLRPHVCSLAKRLACSTDFVFALVNRICKSGPENVRATEMLKISSNGGKGTSRLNELIDKALDSAVVEVCVNQGRKPGTAGANEAIRLHMRTAGIAGNLPTTHTIKKRSMAPAIATARDDAYERDHLNRIAGCPDEIQSLMEVVMLDTTQFTNEDYELRVVDDAGRDMGPANVIFGVLGSNRGVWTYRGFAGAANGFLSGLAIKRGLVSKGHLLDRYGIPGVWPFHGKPSELRHDNGSEFVNEHVKRVLKEMNIGFDDRSPPKTPHLRGANERFNRMAHSFFKKFLESSCGRRYRRPVKGNKTALGITLKDLDRALAEWIVTDYHGRAHKGLGGDSPMSRFEKFVEGGNGLAASGLPMAVDDTDELIWDFLWEEKRTVNHLGISFRNRRYSCLELSSLFAQHRRSSRRKIPFRFHPYRMGSVFIRVPDDDKQKKPIEVPWIPENEKYRATIAEQFASADPSLWEWDALYADIRRGCTAEPTRGVV